MSLVKMKFILTSIILVTATLLTTCGNFQKKNVARVGGRLISVQEFESAFAQGKKTKQIQSATLEQKKEFLNTMIDKKMKVIDAYQHHLDKDEKIQKTLDERVKGIMFRHLIDKEVVEKIIPETMVRDYHDKASKEVKIRKILFKFQDQKVSKEEILKKTKKLISRLKDGENFADLAKQISEDEKTAHEGGLVGFLKWGSKSSSDPVYQVAFSMKEDEISEPIETSEGYCIIKVTNIKKYPSPPFEQEKEKIKQNIFKIFSKDIEKAYYAYLDELKKRYEMKINDEGIELFLARFKAKKDTLASSQDIVQEKMKSIKPFDGFSEADNQKALVELSFKTFKIKDFIEQLNNYPPERLPMFNTKEQIVSALNQRVIPILLFEKEIEKRKIKDASEVKRTEREYQDNLMETRIYEVEVTDKVILTDEQIKKYFEEHRDDYKHPPMKEVQEIYVSNESIANRIVVAAKKGENFTSLFNRFNEKKTNEQSKGKLGFISEGRSGIGKPAFSVKVGGVTEPIKIGKGYSIIKVLSEKSEELKTFEESKTIASARLKRETIKNREAEWIAGLRKKISVAIYEKTLEQACKKFYGNDMIMAD